MIFSSYFAFISLPLLPLALADVNCGGHDAPSCEECPYDSNGNPKGPGWCNGECVWNNANAKCAAKPGKRCGGGSSAKICAECPSGEAGCGDTDCTWHLMTSLCRDSFSDDVRTASVHLFYDAPAAVDRPAWWFQRVVPTASAQSTYFSTSAQRFGYGGIQEVNSSTGRVIFSLWDQGGCNQDVDPNCDDKDKAKTVACGTGVRCNGFNGEGTGAHSSYDRAPFSLNEAYYFVTQAKFLGNKRMEYTGYFYENGLWRLLSRIQVATNSNEQWWIDGMYSFVEQWLVRETTKDRGALFGPSYMADEDATDFHQIKTVKFWHGTLENHERVNAWQAGADWQHAVGIETGGNAVPVAKRGDVFTYPDYVPYGELTSFRKKINCLNLAQNKDKIESCLNTTPPTAPTILPTADPTDKPNISPATASTDAPSVSTDVWCGGHGAPSCEKCPYDSNGNYMGPAWCNGECAWNNTDAKCAAKPPTAPSDAPTALLTTDPTDAPSLSPTTAPTSMSPTPDYDCVDTAFMYAGKKTCAQFLGGKNKDKIKQLCNKWDKYGRLVKNHCPKTCLYNCDERCADDEGFIMKHDNSEYNCDDIPNSVITCTTLFMKGKKKSKKQLVAEHCRKSCGICSYDLRDGDTIPF